MSYNIAAGHGDLSRTTEASRASAAGVVALQEAAVHPDAALRRSERAADRAGATAVAAPPARQLAHVCRRRSHLSGDGAGQTYRLRSHLNTLSCPFRMGSRDGRIGS